MYSFKINDKYGRVIQLTVNGILMCVLLSLIAFMFEYEPMGYNIVIAIMIYVGTGSYGATQAELVWCIIGELLNEQGIWLTIIFIQLNQFAFIYIFPLLIVWIGSAITFGLGAFMNLTPAICYRYFLIDTKGLSVEQLEAIFNPKNE